MHNAFECAVAQDKKTNLHVYRLRFSHHSRLKDVGKFSLFFTYKSVSQLVVDK